MRNNQTESGLGAAVPNGDMAFMSERVDGPCDATEIVTLPWRSCGTHTWDCCATIYDRLIRDVL
jgi:hypothetical protein